MNYCVLYNPFSSNQRGKEKAEKLRTVLKNDCFVFHDLTSIRDISEFISNLDEAYQIIVCGGDGTLNRFVNAIYGKIHREGIYYYATGSGNDFLNDIAPKNRNKPVCIDEYLKNLPTVTVKNNRFRFLNGVGFGIDGYVCEEGDRQRETSSKKTNYVLIALKGLLFDYKPVNARVIIDGVEHTYQRVWLAPSMFGRFYGGGMMIAPDQDRNAPEPKLSLVVAHNCSSAQIVCAFPTIKFGKHVVFKKLVEVLTGNVIEVIFDKPAAIQIDGETISNVISYRAEISKE